MNKFSPGPWTHSRHAIYSADAGVPATKPPIAYVAYSQDGLELEDNGAANAALIEAAPELYLALEALLAEVMQPHGLGWLAEPTYQNAQKALAKATGQARGG